jgi:hypothetical protein
VTTHRYWVLGPAMLATTIAVLELSRANSAGFMWSVVDFKEYVRLYILLGSDLCFVIPCSYSQLPRVEAPPASSQDVLFSLLARLFFHALKI